MSIYLPIGRDPTPRHAGETAARRWRTAGDRLTPAGWRPAPGSRATGMPISSRRAPGLDPEPDGSVHLPPRRARAALVRVLLAVGILIAILVTRRQLALRGRDPALAARSPSGPCRAASSGRGCITWPPTGRRSRAISGRSRSSRRAASASTARCSAARSAPPIGARRAGVPLLVILDCAVPGRARAGARPLRQLLQPGAVRRADKPAVGARDRRGEPSVAVPRRLDVPSDVPLRVALEPARDGPPVARRARWRQHPPGWYLALYLALYSLGRFLVEGLRVDPAHEIGPFRLNQVVAAVVFAVSLAALARMRRQSPEPQPQPEARPREAAG